MSNPWAGKSGMLLRGWWAAIAMLLSVGTVCGGEARVVAAKGQPYGVATIEIALDVPIVDRTPAPLQVSDPSHRLFYPYSEDIRVEIPQPSQRPVPRPGQGRLLGRLGGLIRQLASDGKPKYQTVARRVTFLFTGDSPLNVNLFDASGSITNLDVVPGQDELAHRQILSQWWQGYTDAAKRQIDAADYPPWVETYLVAMLSGRLNLPLPDWYLQTEEKEDELLSTLKLIASVEGTDEAIFRQHAAGLVDNELVANLPLPAPPRWGPLYSPADSFDVPVEPMATRVPPECFYIRYGSFANYLWFRDLSNEYGGDISTMVTLRGIENDSATRMEEQLNVKTTELSRALGPSVIEDQALIGRDLFLGDGASMGVLLKSANAFLLRTSLSGDRSQTARDDETITLTEVKIKDRTASFLSSADNRVRSFLVEDDGYFLITNSQTIAERFLEVGQSKQSLAATASFKLARHLMPLDRDDTVFAYFSPEMMRGLVAPEYLIELRRRFGAKSEIAMVHLAEIAASQEGVIAPGGGKLGIPGLMSAGFLPSGFGNRPDGSGTFGFGDVIMDTRRGRRGTFLPIADVKLERVTAAESVWYSEIAAQYSSRFPTFDPLMVGLHREPADPETGIERLSVHAEIAPLEVEKYGKLGQILGPPTNIAMAFADDDIVAAQAHVSLEQLGAPTHLFAAIKDTTPPSPEDFQGLLNIYRSLRGIPGYLGAWPQPGALDRLPLGLGRGQPVGPGLSRLIGGLYRYSDGSFSVLSFWPEILTSVLPTLQAIQVQDDAQVRVRIGNLRGSQIETWVNGQLHKRASRSSAAGASFLSLLSRQLAVPPEDVQSAARKILGADLQCTLGGQYQYSPASKRWISSAWQDESPLQAAPPTYQAPALKWFRGGKANLTQHADRVVADVEILIARDPPQASP